ncbi:hypothetical protein [Calothrix sp. 336/3]|uniref:hypothetical protein n=1 Tax=Calothrix sp. 336/3 TaxID=1337936 RepID=UPI0004E41A28|nr:hypothetical protein [Calothrix sp. 336/3]AKG23544.1 hypothetical protein IJ00_21690 [Calothrix sp. 336/3]
MAKNRILICTFLALISGFFGGFVSGQIAQSLQQQNCEKQAWIFKGACNTFVTTGASWQGNITGLWVGTILGAFVGGLVTHEPN